MRRALTALAASLVSLLPLAAPAHAADYVIETVASGLDHPWSLAFLPDGDMLVTERPGRLRRIHDGVYAETPISGVPKVYHRSQGGLFDILPDPDFANNRLVYLSYAQGTPKANATQVARARLDGNALKDLKVIFTVEPAKDTPVHFGGRMAFLPDGTLLVTTGDGFDYREKAQDRESLLGKVVRINTDGSVPTDNPFVDEAGVNPKIYSYGHRNPQGLVYDPQTDRIYEEEHGPRGGDEVNILEPGANYGWPLATHGVDYSGAEISPFTEYEGTEQPIVYWTPSIAPSGIAVYHGAAFPEWDGDLFAGALAEMDVRRIDMENGAVVGQERLFAELGERIRDVRVGPDGALYLLTDNRDGRVLRVRPAR